MALCWVDRVLLSMTPISRYGADAKLLLRGIHVDLNDAAKALIESKAERLFRHEPRMLRLRIDVERDVRGRNRAFTAKGRIELAGPDLTASVTAAAGPASITLLIDKLDRMLRKRASNLMRRRATEDIRAHVALAPSE
jgi:putative sigma-54 modulation protein